MGGWNRLVYLLLQGSTIRPSNANLAASAKPDPSLFSQAYSAELVKLAEVVAGIVDAGTVQCRPAGPSPPRQPRTLLHALS